MLKVIKALKRHRTKIVVLLFLLIIMMSFPQTSTRSTKKISDYSVSDLIVVGKISQYDGTLLLAWYAEGEDQYIIQDYSLVDVDRVHMLVYSQKLGTTFNLTLMSYYPIINKSSGEEIGRENLKVKNITVSVPNVKTIIDVSIDLTTTNRTEKIIITYYDISFIFYHRTATQYLKQVITYGDYARSLLFNIGLTGLVATISIRHSRHILNKVKYIPPMNAWHLSIILVSLGASYYYLLNNLFDVYLHYQYFLTYGIIYIGFLLLSLQTFTQDPKMWLLLHLPKQEPEAKVLKIWIRFLYADTIDTKLIRIRKTWKAFIARLFGKYEYITVYNFPIPVKETSNSFDRVLFLAKPAEVTEIEFSLAGLLKVFLWFMVLTLSLISIFVFVPAVGLFVTIGIIIIALIMLKKGKFGELKEKIGSTLFKEGKTELEASNRVPVDMLQWLFNYITTEDIARAKEENRQRFLQLKAYVETYTDKKSLEIFQTYKEARDNRLKVNLLIKDLKLQEKKIKTTPEPELQEENKQNKQTGDENEQ